MVRIVAIISFFVLTLWVGQWASAQWVTQSIELQAGWNAVFLEVLPYPAQCDRAFDGVPIESVWWLDQRFSSVQFIQDPDQLDAANPEWRCYFPSDRPESFASNLYILQANQAYMIKAATATVWNVKGTPVWSDREWNPGNYNFTGFHVDPENPPTFADWFAGSAAHAPLDVWSFGADQKWRSVSNPRDEIVQAGRSYWVYAKTASSWQGPVQLNLTAGTKLDYPSYTAEQNVEVFLAGSKDRAVTISLMASEEPPGPIPEEPGADPAALAGDAPVVYYSFGIDDASHEYRDLPVEVNFTASDTLARQLRLAVERKRLPAVVTEGKYQSLLVVRDGKGFRRLLGVSCEGRGAQAAKLTKLRGLRQAAPPAEAGLWVGTVTLNKVSEPNVLNVSPAPILVTDTPAEFNFRIILHMDEQGVVRLLNEVTQMFRNGETMTDPFNPDLQIVLEPARMVLITANPPEAIEQEIDKKKIVPSILRDGRPFANRISTPMFSLRNEEGVIEIPAMTLSGSFYQPGSTLDATLVLENSDPVNPFHHKYHPMHGYPEDGENPLPAMDYTITRHLTLTFTEDSPEGIEPAGWGDNQVGGIYQERIAGLRKIDATTPPVITRGYFILDRLSEVAVLNDGH